jgi:hypothetical protein
VTEAEFTRDVCGLADSLGLLWHHCPDSRRCKGNRGFPDLVVAGPGGLLLAELKMPGGETSAEQDLWGWTIYQAFSTIRLWTPAGLENGVIERELRMLL